MGYISSYDETDSHEGWVAMTYTDGKVSSGTSNGTGHVTGWLPRCECGWTGVETPLPDSADPKWNEPNDEQEELIMGQWRLHLRDVFPGAYTA